MRKGPPRTVADILGPWKEPALETGLIERCKRGWNVPVNELPNEILSTYLRQKIALSLMVPEARKRLTEQFVDGSELYEEELENALKSAIGESID